MTQPPGWGPPADEERPGEPPYPGWSHEQPPPSWAAPGGAPAGQGWGTQPPQPGWGAPPPWGWAAPAAPKPGVVPLRPLGVGEILDGAITTLRRNPAPMLGLSAAVATGSQVLQIGALWLLFRDLAALEDLAGMSAQAQNLEFLVGALTDSVSALLIGLVVSWLATVLLTGVLTVVVSQAVLGRRATAGQAWAEARPQLPRLLGLTLLIGLVVLGPFVVGALPAALAALAGGSGAMVAGLAFLGVLAATPFAVLLYVRLALSTPALMLETTAAATGAGRRSSIPDAMRRSAHLVRGSWWRVLGILLVAAVLAWIVQQVVAVPLTLLTLVVGGLSTSTGIPTTLGLVLQGLGGIIGVTITAPFTAGVVVLLYVDRRIRREGLDLELARAAGVEPPPGPGPELPGSVPPGPA